MLFRKRRTAKALTSTGSSSFLWLESLEPRQMLAADLFEPNDSLGTASFLGSEPVVTLNELTIDTEADVDYFGIVAHSTGRLLISRGEAQVELDILDESGDVMQTLAETSAGSIVIPTVSQQLYFLRASSSMVVDYNLEIENFAAPVPTGIHLDRASDSGMMSDDGVTSRLQPRTLVQVDLSEFEAAGIPFLQPFTADSTTLDRPGDDGILGTADDLPSGAGVAVAVKMTNSSDGSSIMGFARGTPPSGSLFQFEPSGPNGVLAEGDYVVSAQLVVFDGAISNGAPSPSAGRTQFSDALLITIDTSSPTNTAPPTLSTFSDSGMFSTDLVTNKMPIAFTGRLSDSGSDIDLDSMKVRIFGNGELIAEGSSHQGGNWEVTSEPLVDGNYVITAQFEDLAGNVNEWVPESDYVVEVDTLAPNTPLLALVDGSDTGHRGDGLTSDNRPSVSMTTDDSGSGVHLFSDNLKYRIWDRYENAQEFLIYDSAVDIPLDGSSVAGDMFTSELVHIEQLPSAASQDRGQQAGAITAMGDLADGVHHLKLEVEDRAGNISHDFLFDLTIDTAVLPTTFSLLEASDTGMSDSDLVTNINSPTFVGLGEANAKITLFVEEVDEAGVAVGDRSLIGTTTVGNDSSNDDLNRTDDDDNAADGLGVWSINAPALGDGLYRFTVEVDDWAGNRGISDDVLTLEIDTVAPNTPLLNLVSDSGSNGDQRTSDNKPAVSMTTSDEGTAPHLFADNFKFRIFDRFESGEEFLLYDSALDVPVEAVSFTGDGFTSSLINVATLPPLSSLLIGQARGAINSAAELTDGVHHLKLEIEDRAGNISHDFLYDVTIDTVAPVTSIDLLDSSDTGMFNDDDVTSIRSPAFNGESEVAATVTVFAQLVDAAGTAVGGRFQIGSGRVGSDASNDDPFTSADDENLTDGLGLWEVTSEPLGDGIYRIDVLVEDEAGNRSTNTDSLTIEVDGTAPNTPLLNLTSASDTGRVGDGVTFFAAPFTSMTTHDAGAEEHRFQDNFKFRIWDRFGDRVETLIYDSSTDPMLDEVDVAADGFTSSLLAIKQLSDLEDGVHHLKLEVEDRAGNISEDYLYDLTVDTMAPSTKIDLIDSSDSGMFNDDDVSAVDQPTFSGVSEVDATVTVYARRRNADDSLGSRIQIGSGTVGANSTHPDDGQGVWQITSAPLTDGVYEVSVQVEDAAGNIFMTAGEQVLEIEIDTEAPNTPLLALSDLSDTGHQDGTLTADNEPLLTMTTHDAGSDVHLFADNLKYRIWDRFEGQEEFLIYDSSIDGVLDGLSVAGDGFTSSEVNSEQLPSPTAIPTGQLFGAITTAGLLADGTHNLKLEVEDRAGNISHDFLLQITVDTMLDNSSIDLLTIADSGMSDDDQVTNINQPAFAGLAEIDGHVTLFARQINNNGMPVSPRFPIGTAEVGSDSSNDDPATMDDDANASDGLGVWEITSEPLHDGIYQFSALFEDWAGNRQDITEGLVVEIDTLAPNLPQLDLLASSDSGRHDADDVTNDNTPAFSMTTEDRTANPMVYDHLLDENLKYRVYARPGGDLSLAEVLVYDSADDAGLALLDGLTSERFLQRILPGTGPLAGMELPDGVHNFKLEVEDRAGNISHDRILDLTIDTVDPDGTGDFEADRDTGIWGYPETLVDRITADPTLAFAGTAEANTIVTALLDGEPIGTTVAVPLDGNDAFDPPNAPYENVVGNWQLQTGVVVEDGAHFASMVFEDLAGNRGNVDVDEPIYVDTQGPRITNVTRNDAGFTSVFEPKPSGGPDPMVPSIVVHFTDAPDRIPAFEYEAVFQPLAEEEGNYRLVGDASGNIPIVSALVVFEEVIDNVAISRVELTFAEPLPDDRFTLTVSDVIADRANNALDGESGALAPFEGNDGQLPTDPIFPTGDGQHGGSFHARFTIDSRPEIGTWAAGSVWVDTNGNFSFDPQNNDFVNRDITYALGFTSDHVFAGNFVADSNGVADGFDKLAAWGMHDKRHRWLIDVDNDGVPDIDSVDSNKYGLPAAGDFDGNPLNGDEVSALHQGWWFFDTDHDFKTDYTLSTNLVGYPVIGDFDGNGLDDLATWTDDQFQIDLDGGVAAGWDGIADVTFRFGFIGTREVPVSADMDQDGFDDLGLWSPDREGVTPGEAAEWYFLVSGGESLLNRVVTATDIVKGGERTIEYTPTPFGHDFLAQFGDEFAMPVVGNFDPPVLPATSGGSVPAEADWHNDANPLDVDDDGSVLTRDLLYVVNAINDKLDIKGIANDGLYLDVSGDGSLSAIDVLMIVNYLNETVAKAEGEDPSLAASVDAFLARDLQTFESKATNSPLTTLIAEAEQLPRRSADSLITTESELLDDLLPAVSTDVAIELQRRAFVPDGFEDE